MTHRPAFLTLVLLAACAAVSRADIAPDPLGSGITPQPRGVETQVAMTAEEVDLALSKTRLEVKVTFHLENFGKQSAFEVGFPMNYKDELKDFTVEIDGKASTPAIKEQSSEPWPGKVVYSYWLVWDMDFAPAAKKTVVVTYNVPPGNHGFEIQGNSSTGWEDLLGGEDVEKSLSLHHTGYILQTGAPWRGPIGKAVVRLKLEDGLTAANLRQLSPPPTSRGAASIEWDFTDLEPKDDIEISFCPTTTLDREIEIIRGLNTADMDIEDALLFEEHLADLLALKGDEAGRRAGYEAMLDTVIACQSESLRMELHCAEAIGVIAAHLFGTPEDLADAATAARAKKASEFLDRWIPFVRSSGVWNSGEALSTARAALVKVRKAQGRDARDIVGKLEIDSAAGMTMEVADGDADKASLIEERAAIAVGDKETTYDTVYVVQGRRDAELSATVGYPLDPPDAELVAAAGGTFDNLQVTIGGAAVKVGTVSRSLIDNFETTPHSEPFVGWTIPVKAGQTVEVRVRFTIATGGGYTGYVWKPSTGGPPDDERRFDRHGVSWTARGTCWKSPRKLTVSIVLPDGVPATHMRHLAPESGKLDGATVRWSVDALDTSGAGSGLTTWVEWNGFTLDEEIAHLRKLLTSAIEAPELVRFQLAWALHQAGHFADEIEALEAVIAYKVNPLTIGGSGSRSLEPGMYETRPLECYILDARRKLGDDKATRAAADRAVAVLNVTIAATHGPAEEEASLWNELAGIERSLGHEKEAAAAEEKAKGAGK